MSPLASSSPNVDVDVDVRWVTAPVHVNLYALLYSTDALRDPITDLSRIAFPGS